MPNTLDSSVFLLRIFAYLLYVLEMKKRHEIDSNIQFNYKAKNFLKSNIIHKTYKQ